MRTEPAQTTSGLRVSIMGVEFWATGFEGLVSGYENLFCFRYRGVRAPWRQRRDSRPRVQGPGFRVQRSEFRVQGPRFRVQGSGFRVQGSGCTCALEQRFLMAHNHDRPAVVPQIPLQPYLRLLTDVIVSHEESLIQGARTPLYRKHKQRANLVP